MLHSYRNMIELTNCVILVQKYDIAYPLCFLGTEIRYCLPIVLHWYINTIELTHSVTFVQKYEITKTMMVLAVNQIKLEVKANVSDEAALIRL